MPNGDQVLLNLHIYLRFFYTEITEVNLTEAEPYSHLTEDDTYPQLPIQPNLFVNCSNC